MRPPRPGCPRRALIALAAGLALGAMKGSADVVKVSVAPKALAAAGDDDDFVLKLHAYLHVVVLLRERRPPGKPLC